MPIVPNELRDRIKRHLGYNRPRAINPATMQKFDEHLNSILTNGDIYSKTGPSIINLVERCDELWEATDPLSSKLYSQFQQIIGDVNRQTRTVTMQDALKNAKELYLNATDELAFYVNLPNLQRPINAQHQFYNLGGEYVLAPPGAADTCISDRIWLSNNAA